MDKYYVYILKKNHTVLYVGFSDKLKPSSKQHKDKSNKGFTTKHNVYKLVYFESTQYVNNAIKREKQIKHWKRQWKENPINDMKPDWDDLSWILGD